MAEWSLVISTRTVYCGLPPFNVLPNIFNNIYVKFINSPMRPQYFSSSHRQPLSNIKSNHEVSPFIKQLKSFEQRLKHYKPRLKPLKKHHAKPSQDEVMKCVKHIISTGTTIDCFQTERLKPYEEYEEDYYRERHIEVLDRVRNFRVKNSGMAPEKTQTSLTRFGSTELTSREIKSTVTQRGEKGRELDWEKEKEKQNKKKSSEVSFLSYKRVNKF